MLVKMFVAMAALVVWAAPAAAETRDYTWLTVGEPSGSQSVTYHEDGSTTVTFEFNDRGRGPDTTTRIQLNEFGVPDSLTITGVNYQKGEVNERLSSTQDRTSWSSAVETGSAPLDGRAFYWPVNPPPEVMAMLARAILAAPDRRLKLLPSGTATIEKVAERTLRQSQDTRNISLYAIAGLDPSPVYLWLDDQLAYFGIDYGWFAITESGWESHLDTLKEAQQSASDAYYRKLSAALSHPMEGLLVIRGAKLFDSLSGEITDPATVFVWKGEITAVYFEDVVVPDGAEVIAGEGKTLLPGLWDMHAHVSVGSYLGYLASGVTNVRDMANDDAILQKLVDDVRSGQLAGPEVVALGFIDKRGEFSAPTGRLADTLEEALRYVDDYAQRGYKGIKLYSSIEPEWVKPIADRAHSLGLTVQGHVPAYMNASQAIDAGYDEITHINMVLLNFLGGEALDTRTPTRFKVPGEKSGELNLRDRKVRRFVRRMAEEEIALDTTAAIFIDMFRNEPGKISHVFRDIADHFPANTRRQSISSTGYNEGAEEAYAKSADRTLELLRVLHQAGVRLLPGTDNALPGFTLVRELQYYAEAGIPANEVLQLATIEAARHMGMDHELGSITPGKKAHLVLVEGDPTTDLANLYRVRDVVKGRSRYRASEILDAFGFKPFD